MMMVLTVPLYIFNFRHEKIIAKNSFVRNFNVGLL